jgi:hypothetical protein
MEKGFVEDNATLGVANLNMNKVTFQVDDFLTDLDFIEMGEVQGDEEPFFDIQGAWRGKVTSTQQWINIESDFVKFIKNKLYTIDALKFNVIDGIQILRSKNPYDVHSDWVVTNNQVPIADPIINPPTYTVIIPIVDGDYKTIIFDQSAKYNNFSKYKKLNHKIENHCEDYEWDKYCGHCIKDDQKYLTIKEVFHWKRGTMFVFDRRLFHCSANFGNTPKMAIVMWLSLR